jgi:hypothetical protein
VEKLHEVRLRYFGGVTPAPPRRPAAPDTLLSGDLQSDDESQETTGSRR